MGTPRRDDALTDDEHDKWEERATKRQPRVQRIKRSAEQPSGVWVTPFSMETKLEIRPRIKEFRIKRLMTQKQLSEKSGVSVSAISRVESGLTYRMRLEGWMALADALDVKVDDLFDAIEVPMTEEEIREKAERVAQRRAKEAARQRARRQAAAESRERQRAKEERQLAERRDAWEARQRQRAGAANDADPPSESPERPLPGDRMRKG